MQQDSNGTHIFNWAMSDAGCYRHARVIRETEPASAVARAALSYLEAAMQWAHNAYKAGRDAGDIREPYSLADIAEAAAMMLADNDLKG